MAALNKPCSLRNLKPEIVLPASSPVEISEPDPSCVSAKSEDNEFVLKDCTHVDENVLCLGTVPESKKVQVSQTSECDTKERKSLPDLAVTPGCSENATVCKTFDSENSLDKLVLVIDYKNKCKKHDPANWIKMSASVCNMIYRVKEVKPKTQGISHYALLDGKPIEMVNVQNSDMQEAEQLLARKLLTEKLSLSCMILEENHPLRCVTHKQVEELKQQSKFVCLDTIKNLEEEIIRSDNEGNIGMKLMKKMGYAGGALGKNESGIQNPIPASVITDRNGLGFSKVSQLLTSSFNKAVEKFITQLKNNGIENRILFSDEFDRQRIYVIKTLLDKHKLDPKMYKCGQQVFLSVSPRLSVYDRVSNVLQNGGKTVDYRVHMPGSYDINKYIKPNCHGRKMSCKKSRKISKTIVSNANLASAVSRVSDASEKCLSNEYVDINCLLDLAQKAIKSQNCEDLLILFYSHKYFSKKPFRSFWKYSLDVCGINPEIVIEGN